jgi:hypothetical protein
VDRKLRANPLPIPRIERFGRTQSLEKYMDTIDIKIDVPAPPREDELAIERAFAEKATRAGAINTHILKKNGCWTYVAEFVDTEKAAVYASGLTKAMGTRCKIDMKPTRNDAKN